MEFAICYMATFNCICIYNCNCKCICICICICNWVSGGHIGLLEGSATLTRFRLCCRLFFSTLFNCILFSLTVKATAKTARRRICAMHTPHTRPFCPKLYNCRRTGRLLNGLQLKRVSNCILIMLFIWLNFETLSYRAFFFFGLQGEVSRADQWRTPDLRASEIIDGALYRHICMYRYICLYF